MLAKEKDCNVEHSIPGQRVLRKQHKHTYRYIIAMTVHVMPCCTVLNLT